MDSPGWVSGFRTNKGSVLAGFRAGTQRSERNATGGARRNSGLKGLCGRYLVEIGPSTSWCAGRMGPPAGRPADANGTPADLISLSTAAPRARLLNWMGAFCPSGAYSRPQERSERGDGR
jgi:hypothetical protein